jgi:hypothetical protein
LKRWEWREQVKLAPLLDRWLPRDAFWTATDPYVGSAMTGWMRRLRGVRRGVPDDLIWVCGQSICIELKSPGGRCSREQREARAALLRAGAQWWECRSAHAAMWALAESGVKFREIVGEDGTVQRWEQPKLEDWEQPRRDPSDRRPQHPAMAAERRDAARRRRERERARSLEARDDGLSEQQARQSDERPRARPCGGGPPRQLATKPASRFRPYAAGPG